MRDPQAGIRALGIGRTEASMLPTLVALSGEGGMDQPPVTEVSGDDKARRTQRVPRAIRERGGPNTTAAPACTARTVSWLGPGVLGTLSSSDKGKCTRRSFAWDRRHPPLQGALSHLKGPKVPSVT